MFIPHIIADTTWERTSICRSCGGRSSPTCCVFCFVSDAGSTVSSPASTVLLDPPDPTRPAVWDTRLSKVSNLVWACPHVCMAMQSRALGKLTPYMWVLVPSCKCKAHRWLKWMAGCGPYHLAFLRILMWKVHILSWQGLLLSIC